MRKIFYNSGIRIMFLLVFILLVHYSYSQEKTIKIIDEKTELGIPDVHYHYGEASGFSDNNGNILLQLTDDTELFLSHLQYGKIAFSSDEVKNLANEGVITLAQSSTYLPAALVLVHPAAGNNKTMEFSVQHKLAHDAGNLLESVPSISTIRKSGAYGFDPVLRGFKYDQINLVLDGSQTASAACPNRMDPAASQIPINMIAEAEVLKGPHSLRYGNAFGGTINFKSSTPDFKEKTKVVGRLGTSYESNGNIFRTEGVAGVAGPKVDFRLFGAYSTGDDYTDGEGVEIAARFNRLNWGGKLGVKLSQTQNMGVLVSNNIAKDVDFPALPMDLREDNTWLVNASHSAVFYDKVLTSWNTSLYGTMVDHLMDNYDKVLDPRMVDAITDAETRNYGGRTELRFDFDKSYLYAGADYRFESADGYRERTMLMGPMNGKVFTDNVWQDAEINRTGIFGEWHIAHPGFQFVISGRLDINSSKAKNPDPTFEEIYSDLESSQVHPSVSVGGTRLFNENFSLGLWMGMATRSPGIAERYINQFPIGLDPYEMLGNPDLDPEKNNQLDLVFRYQTAKTHINVNVFTSVLRDYISSEIREDLQPAMSTSPGVRQFVNIKKALMTGFEAGWTQQLSSFLSHDLSVVYTYGKNQKLDEPLPEIPPLEIKYRLMGNFTGSKVKPEILFRHAMKQNRIAESYGETKTPAFSVVDAKLSWLINSVFTMTGGVQNLFDEAYYEHLSRSVRGAESRPIYSPGRSFYATLTISFL
ncbi:TonB-dependent receptor [Draconibacterium sp. IB214405]|uniref:TonB-dependent receptor domain-containing protein n=1 Tax=Draconibacterium sp. IB214405 TaxID=3097352 RepID=UPI002A178B34|nr:TonB-dependent receptor [Draconibacterium sp. IB214405]MDX8339965.1 TonB-dependent receptor [Draconibacterium sp. IB214405]